MLRNLRRARFRPAAAIYASATGRPRVDAYDISAIGGVAAALSFSLVWRIDFRGSEECWRITGRLGLLCYSFAFALAGAVGGLDFCSGCFNEHVDEASLAWCTKSILPNEAMVIAEVEASETPRVLAILRDVEAEAPRDVCF